MATRVSGERASASRTCIDGTVEGAESPSEIATGYDVFVAAVHAALAYGFANPEEMEAIAECHEEARSDADAVAPEDL